MHPSHIHITTAPEESGFEDVTEHSIDPGASLAVVTRAEVPSVSFLRKGFVPALALVFTAWGAVAICVGALVVWGA